MNRAAAFCCADRILFLGFVNELGVEIALTDARGADLDAPALVELDDRVQDDESWQDGADTIRYQAHQDIKRIARYEVVLFIIFKHLDDLLDV